MKASPIMIFEYAGMLGVPALLVLLAVFSIAGVAGTARTILLLVIAAGCLVYGAIAVREVFLHGPGPGGARHDVSRVGHVSGNGVGRGVASPSGREDA